MKPAGGEGEPAFSKRGPEARPRACHGFLGPGRCIFLKAIQTSWAGVSPAAGPSHGHRNNDLDSGEGRPLSTQAMTVRVSASKAPEVRLDGEWGKRVMGRNASLRSNWNHSCFQRESLFSLTLSKCTWGSFLADHWEIAGLLKAQTYSPEQFFTMSHKTTENHYN